MKEAPESWHAQIFEQIRGYLFDNLALKALAALIVTALWLSVAGQTRSAQEEVTLHNLDILLRNPPPTLAITSTVPLQVDVHLRGPQDVIRDLRLAVAMQSSDLVPFVDLNKTQEGAYKLPIQLQGLPEGVTVVNGPTPGIAPSFVRVTLEPLRTKEVPVDARFIGRLPEGYRVVATSVEPAAVVLSGPESKIADIERAETTTVNLNGRTANFAETVDVDANDSDFVQVKSGRVTVHVDVAPEVGEATIANVPVAVAGQPGAAVSPETVDVTVRGPVPAIRQLSAAMLAATVGDADAPPGDAPTNRGQQLPVTLALPPGVEVVRITPDTVRLRPNR